MITKNQYIEYLLNTPINYTCSNLSEHLENVSHDVGNGFFAELSLYSERVVGIGQKSD